MKIELLWFPGCPNWRDTDTRLRQALPLAGVDADVVLVEVTTPEDAERLRFRGSPTVLLDGSDPFAEDSDPVGLSCRVYRTTKGLKSAPTVGMLATRCGARRDRLDRHRGVRVLRQQRGAEQGGRAREHAGGVRLPQVRGLGAAASFRR